MRNSMVVCTVLFATVLFMFPTQYATATAPNSQLIGTVIENLDNKIREIDGLLSASEQNVVDKK